MKVFDKVNMIYGAISSNWGGNSRKVLVPVCRIPDFKCH